MRNFATDLAQAKQDEQHALNLVNRLEGIEWSPSTPEEDKRGIDAHCVSSDGTHFTVDVKTYAFDWEHIRNKKWWDKKQQVVIEVRGGHSSATFQGEEGADRILYHYRCMNPFVVGLQQTRNLMQQGFVTHLWMERAFCTWLVDNWHDYSERFRIRFVNNTQSNGSMLLLGVHDLQSLQWIYREAQDNT